MTTPADDHMRKDAADGTPSDPMSYAALLEECVALRKLNDHQAALLDERYADLRLVSFVNGHLNLQGGPIPVFVEYFAQMLGKGGDGPISNYTETRVHDVELGELVLTLQRSDGKTPHELRRAAEAQRDGLAAAISEATDNLFKATRGPIAVANTLFIAKNHILRD